MGMIEGYIDGEVESRTMRRTDVEIRAKRRKEVENIGQRDPKQESRRGGSLRHIKHLPQSPFIGKLFKMTTFCIAFYQSNLSMVRRGKDYT